MAVSIASSRVDKEIMEFFSSAFKAHVKGVTALGMKKVGFEFNKQFWILYRSSDFSQPPILYRMYGQKMIEIPVSIVWKTSMTSVEFVLVCLKKIDIFG